MSRKVAGSAAGSLFSVFTVGSVPVVVVPVVVVGAVPVGVVGAAPVVVAGFGSLSASPVTFTLDVGGVSVVVINDKTGFVTRKSTEELAKALEKLISSKALRTAQGKAAKGHAIKAFSVEKMIKAHVSLYKKLAK